MDLRAVVPRIAPEALPANKALVNVVKSRAKRKNATPSAQVALAQLLAQKPWIVPTPGAIKLHRLDENCGAASIHLTADELERISIVVTKILVHGERFMPRYRR